MSGTARRRRWPLLLVLAGTAALARSAPAPQSPPTANATRSHGTAGRVPRDGWDVVGGWDAAAAAAAAAAPHHDSDPPGATPPKGGGLKGLGSLIGGRVTFDTSLDWASNVTAKGADGCTLPKKARPHTAPLPRCPPPRRAVSLTEARRAGWRFAPVL